MTLDELYAPLANSDEGVKLYRLIEALSDVGDGESAFDLAASTGLPLSRTEEIRALISEATQVVNRYGQTL